MGAVRCGAAYVFQYGGGVWHQTVKLIPADGEYADEFGYSVSLESGLMLAGAPYEDQQGYNAGAAYVFGSYFADCNHNGYPDDCDIASGVSADRNQNGVPDECEFGVADLNCDGAVNFDDINPFVLALSDPAGYAQLFPNCNILSGDINGDGRVDFGDINPFVALLTGH